jgi:phenylacetate-CoA ligase
MDELVVQAEVTAAINADSTAQSRFRDRLERELRVTLGVRAIVQLEAPGALPRTEFKARRVIDNRDLYREAMMKEDGIAPATLNG